MQELLTSAREQWQKEQDDLNKLLIKAPTAGTVLPAPVKKTPPNVDGRLPQWSGSLLDPINLGTFVEPNDQLCLIGDPQQYEALLAVDQSDLDYLKPGQRVRVKLDSYAGDIIETEIKTQDDISRTPMEFASQSMSVQAGGKLATRTDAAGITRPLSTTYQVTVPLPGDAHLYKPGLRGRAKVSADPRSLGWRLMHFITRTFRFDL